MDWFLIIATIVKILLVVSILLLSVAMLVLAERKVAAWTQNRLGPNRVGPGGLLQPFADVFKLLVKEDIVPVVANRLIHALAPMLALFVAFTTYAVIPPGPSVEIFGRTVNLVIADVDMGILYVLALTSIGVYAITFSGWSSGSKYSLLGGIRSSAQMISYEISMGFSIAGVLLFAESLRPLAIVQQQIDIAWNIVLQPLGFITFVTAAFAETNRLPFDLPEAEPELVGGYHTEYSSMKFAGFFLAEYANMIVASGLIVTLYLGGWHVPFISGLELPSWLLVLIQVGAFFVKIGALLFFFLWVRWSLPRFRYDQLMDLGWKVMFPLTLLNLLWAAVLVMLIK